MWRAGSLEKTLMLGKTEVRRRRGRQRMRWHHPFEGPEFEQPPGVGNGQGILVCCSPRGCKVLQTNEQLNWTEPLGYQGIPKIWCFHLRIIHVFAYFFGIAFPTFSIWVCMALSSSYIMKSQMAQSSFLNSPIILILQTHFLHCFLYYLREDRCHHICTNF